MLEYGGFLKQGYVPLNNHFFKDFRSFSIGFSTINHPAIGVPFMEPPHALPLVVLPLDSPWARPSQLDFPAVLESTGNTTVYIYISYIYLSIYIYIYISIYIYIYMYTLHAGSGTRAHPEKRQSRKAAMERSSRKAAKPPWNAQAAKPQSCHGARKPQSRKAAMERASRKAAKPQSCHGTRKPQSRKAAEPQALRLMRRLLRSSPLRCHRHEPESRKLWDAGAVSCVHRRCVARASRSVKEPQSAKASKHHEASKRQSFKKRQSVKKRQSFKKRHSAEASKSRQRKAGCA